MVTQKEIDELAETFLKNYIKSCHCNSRQDVANVLMKMALFCGAGMCTVVGYAEGIERIEGVARYTAESEKDTVWNSQSTH